MIRSCVQRCVLCAAVLAAACSALRDDRTARATIDVRCSSNADCPTGFVCETETEHGPPTTMCESYDPAAICPREFETHVGYGQVFCLPRLSVRPHGDSIMRAARVPHGPTSEVDLLRAVRVVRSPR